MDMEKWGIKGARLLEELNDHLHGKVIPFLTEKGWFFLKSSGEVKSLSLEQEDENETLKIPYREYMVQHVQNAYRGEMPFNYVIQVLDEAIQTEDVIGAVNERRGGIEHIVLDYIRIDHFYFFQTKINKRKCM